MNKVIKYRVWNKKVNQFLYFGQPSFEYNDGVGMYLVPENDYSPLDFGCLEEEDFVIQQYTGLKDKNGIEVYEGDIVCEIMTEETAANGGGSLVAPICFDGGAFVISGHGPMFDHTFNTSSDILEDFYVVGNIFEHPELLK